MSSPKLKKNQSAPKRKVNKIGGKTSDMVVAPSTNIYVTTAPGKGRGVFASTSIQKNDTVEIAPGLYINRGEYPLISATTLKDYTFTAADEKGSFVALGCASLYNHDSKPNAEWIILNKEWIVIKALRDIKKDEEITMDYGWDDEHLKDVGIKS